MKNLILLPLFFLFSTSAFSSDFALGVVLGIPTGLSAKYDLSKSNIIQVGVSGAYSSVDYMWIDDRNFDVSGLTWLYGAGAVVAKNIGVRGVTGVEYDLKDYPFHLQGNVSFAIANGTQLGAVVGARYDF